MGEGENAVLDFDLGSFFSSASVWDYSQFETVVIIIGAIGYSLYSLYSCWLSQYGTL